MLKNYLKLAYRVFLRRKFFTFISLFGVAFTIVVLMVVTAFFDHLIGARAPEVHAGRTLSIFSASLKGPQNTRSGFAGYRLLDTQARELPHVERVSLVSMPASVSALKEGVPVDLYLRHTDGAFWQILDFAFLEGGPFTAEDDRNANPVAVINEATRARFFDAGPAVGQTIEVDGQRFRVVGVVANVPMFRPVAFSDVWVPTGTMRTDTFRREIVGNYMALLLARSRADFPEIKAAYAARIAAVEPPDPREFDRVESRAYTLLEGLLSMFGPGGPEEAPVRTFFVTLGLLALLFMTLPAINLININMSRILERASEIGVRKAFGASSRVLVGQFLVENVVLSLAGGMIGLAGAFVVLELVSASGVLPYAAFRLNGRIFLYAVFFSTLFGLLSGVYPAWRMSRLHPVDALRGGTHV